MQRARKLAQVLGVEELHDDGLAAGLAADGDVEVAVLLGHVILWGFLFVLSGDVGNKSIQ